MELEIADWVYVAPGVKRAATGLGVIKDAKSVHADGTLETARVEFVGWASEGHVYSAATLVRVTPTEEVGVVFAAYLHGLIDDALMRELVRTWQTNASLSARTPGLLSRLWELRPPGVPAFLATTQPGPWLEHLATWVLELPAEAPA